MLAGLWLILSPFILGHAGTGPAVTNEVIVGILAIIFAAARIVTDGRTTWPSWINFLLGIWLILSPFIFNYTNVRNAMTNDIVLGIIVGGLAAMNAMNRPVERPM